MPVYNEEIAVRQIAQRRGWLEKKDVLNTRPLATLRTLLAATR